MKRILKRCAIALCAILLIGGVGMGIYVSDYYPAAEEAIAVMDSTDTVAVAARKNLTVLTSMEPSGTGFIFYPGGKVEHKAYLPLLKRLAAEGVTCILVEMPHGHWSEQMYRELAAICEKQKLLPVIAHVDRYISPFHTHKIPRKLAQLPVYVQANAEFFLERSTAGMAMRMLKQGQIQLLGSDCHNMESRKPNLGEAVEKIRRKLGEEALDMIRDYESKVLGR